MFLTNEMSSKIKKLGDLPPNTPFVFADDDSMETSTDPFIKLNDIEYTDSTLTIFLGDNSRRVFVRYEKVLEVKIESIKWSLL